MKNYKRDYKKYKSLYKTSLKGGDIRKCIVNFNIKYSMHEKYWKDLYMFVLDKLGIVSIQIKDIPEVMIDTVLSGNLAAPVMSDNTPMVERVLTILQASYPESLNTGGVDNPLVNIRLHLGEAYSHSSYELGKQYIWIRREESIVDKHDLGLAYILKFLNFGDITRNYYNIGDTGLNTFIGQTPNTIWDNTQADDNQYLSRCPNVQTIRNPDTRRNTTRLPNLFKWLLGFRLDTKTYWSVNNASYQVMDDPNNLGLMRYLIRDYTDTVDTFLNNPIREHRFREHEFTDREDNIFKIGELIDNLCERSMNPEHIQNLNTHGVETVTQNRDVHLQTKNRLYDAFDVPYNRLYDETTDDYW